MSDTEQQAAGVDYIAIIKAAKEHGVMHLKIGSFEITMQAPARDSLSHLSQPQQLPQLAAPGVSNPNYVYAPLLSPGVSTTTTAEPAKRGTYASKLEKIHQKRQQFDDFRNLKPPGKEDASEGEN